MGFAVATHTIPGCGHVPCSCILCLCFEVPGAMWAHQKWVPDAKGWRPEPFQTVLGAPCAHATFNGKQLTWSCASGSLCFVCVNCFAFSPWPGLCTYTLTSHDWVILHVLQIWHQLQVLIQYLDHVCISCIGVSQYVYMLEAGHVPSVHANVLVCSGSISLHQKF